MTGAAVALARRRRQFVRVGVRLRQLEVAGHHQRHEQSGRVDGELGAGSVALAVDRDGMGVDQLAHHGAEIGSALGLPEGAAGDHVDRAQTGEMHDHVAGVGLMENVPGIAFIREAAVD